VLTFRNRRARNGWVAVALSGAHAHAVAVERAGAARPKVRWAQTLDWRQPVRSLAGVRRQHGLGRQRNVFVLQRPSYQMVPLEAPELPREEWRDAVRWQLREAVDFDVADASMDMLELPADPQQRRKPQLLAVAAARSALAPLVAQAQDARLPVQAIDIPETALRNISALAADGARAQALLSLDAQQGTLVVTAGTDLLLARHFDLGTEPLDAAEAEGSSPALDRLALELQRTFDNFERQFSHLSLARLLLSADPPQPRLAQALASLLYVPVAPLRLEELFDLSSVPALHTPAAQARYLSALGAALRDTRT
jgi:MSHA biogenesis protein MshI